MSKHVINGSHEQKKKNAVWKEIAAIPPPEEPRWFNSDKRYEWDGAVRKIGAARNTL